MKALYSVNPEIDLGSLKDESIIEFNAPSSSYNAITSTSYSDARVSFSAMISGTQILNRAMLLKLPLKVTYVGTTTGTNLLDSNYDALRSLPDLRVITNLAVTLNGQSVMVGGQYNEWCPDIMVHYNDTFRERHQLSYPDMSSEYSTMVDGFGNPLATLINTENNEQLQKRGAFQPREGSITRTSTGFTAIYDLYGWITIPGLLGPDQANSTGLIGINQFTVELILNLSAQNVVSHALANSVGTASPSTITSVAVTTLNAGVPVLTYKLIPLPSDMKIPPVVQYNHYKAIPFLTTNATLASGASSTYASQAMILDYVPKYAFVYVKENLNNKLISTPDTFATINNINVNFNGLTGQLGSATPVDLFQMSQDCGSRQSMINFLGKANVNRAAGDTAWLPKGTQGSLLCLEFGRHIPLNDQGLQIGSRGNFNLQLTANVTNNGAVAITSPTLYVVCFMKQTITIMDHMVMNGAEEVGGQTGGIVLGGYTLSQAINNEIPLHKVDYNSRVGGGWWGNAWNMVKNMAKKTKILQDIAKSIPVIGTPLAKVADHFGYGVQGGAMEAPAPAPKSGGQTITKSSLKNLLTKI